MLFNIFTVLYYLIIPITVFFKYSPIKNRFANIGFALIITFIYVLVYLKFQVTTADAYGYVLEEANVNEGFINMYEKLSKFYCAIFPIACSLGYVSLSEIIKTPQKE